MTDNRTNEPTEAQVEAAVHAAWAKSREFRGVGGQAEFAPPWEFQQVIRAALVAAQGASPAHLVIDREALIHAIAARHWDEDSGEVENWDGLTASEKQNVIDNYLCPRVADAVIAHLSAAPQAERDWRLDVVPEPWVTTPVLPSSPESPVQAFADWHESWWRNEPNTIAKANAQAAFFAGWDARDDNARAVAEWLKEQGR